MRKRLFFVVILLWACGSDRRPTEPLAVTPAANRVWSGGTLRLDSPAFMGADSLPTVVVGADTLAVRSGGPGIALVQLPDTNGPLTLSITASHSRTVSLSITTYGFEQSRTGPPVEGPPMLWPGRGAPTALAISNGRLALLDYRLNTAVSITSDTGLGSPWLGGPGPSAEDSALVVIAPCCGAMIAVPLLAGAPPPDTGPPPMTFWPAAHLGRGRWLHSRKHWLEVRVRQPDGSFTSSASASCEEPHRFVISPRARRVVPIGCAPVSPLPVYATGAGGLAYQLNYVSGGGGAAFTDLGDTLFMTGTDALRQGAWLFAIDPSSGAQLARVPVENSTYADVVIDPAQPWLYVGAIQHCAVSVHVFDRRTLELVATLRAPADAAPHDYPACTYQWDYVLVLDGAQRHLYVTINVTFSGVGYRPTPASHVVVFDLMP